MDENSEIIQLVYQSGPVTALKVIDDILLAGLFTFNSFDFWIISLNSPQINNNVVKLLIANYLIPPRKYKF